MFMMTAADANDGLISQHWISDTKPTLKAIKCDQSIQMYRWRLQIKCDVKIGLTINELPTRML